MGCRPSRRAVACVRVAGPGEGATWGVGRPSLRPGEMADAGAVRLRRRSSSKRCEDERKCQGGVRCRGGGGVCVGGGGGNPRDRYSAPPATDRIFPPHSCTSATYKHGCCGTSRITLRLSKNGSTLEIEKCEFDHGLKTCKVCNPDPAPAVSVPPQQTCWRTQSAPNLSILPPVLKDLSCPLPPLPPHRYVVVSETHPSPVYASDSDHPCSDLLQNNNNNVVLSDISDSSSDSVMTVTKVNMEVDSHEATPPASSFKQLLSSKVQTNYCFTPESPIHTRNKSACMNKMFKVGLASSKPLTMSPDSLSENDWSLHSSLHSLHSLQMNHLEKETSYLLRNADKISHTTWANCKVKESVDLTTFYHVNNHLFVDDLDMGCASACGSGLHMVNGVSICSGGSGEAAAGNWSEHHVYDNANKLSFDHSSSSHHSESKSYISEHTATAETDYRVRMLTVDSDSDKLLCGVSSGAAEDMMKVVLNGESQVLVSIHSNQIPDFYNNTLTSGRNAFGGCCLDKRQSELLVNGSLTERVSADLAMNTTANDKHHKLINCANSMCKNAAKRRQYEESTDTSGCESDNDNVDDAEEKLLELDRLELVPAYVHADFQNDFEDLFDDSSPELDAA